MKMAVASKSPARPTAEAMLKKLGFMDLFSAVTIFHRPSKHEHFRRIKEETGTALADMLFFDDEGYNIRTMSALGVTCVDVSRGGLSVVALEKGLSMHAESRMGQCGF